MKISHACPHPAVAIGQVQTGIVPAPGTKASVPVAQPPSPTVPAGEGKERSY